MSHGAEVIYGSDWPAAALDANPWTGLAGMLTRADMTGTYPGTVAPDEAITLAQALPLFTTNAARALRLQGLTGHSPPAPRLTSSLLDRTLGQMHAEDIAACKPMATLFEGQIVHGEI